MMTSERESGFKGFACCLELGYTPDYIIPPLNPSWEIADLACALDSDCKLDMMVLHHVTFNIESSLTGLAPTRGGFIVSCLSCA